MGTPGEVLDRPATPFVAGFVADAVRLDGLVTDGVFRAPGIEAPADGADDGPATVLVRTRVVRK